MKKYKSPIQVGRLVAQTFQERRLGYPPGEEPWQAELIVESEGGTEVIVEEGSYACHVRSGDQLQKWAL